MEALPCRSFHRRISAALPGVGCHGIRDVCHRRYDVPPALYIGKQEIMMRIIDLAIKDLAQIFRDKRALLFLVAMPIIFTLFMGFAYKSGTANDAAKDNRI